MAIYKEVDGLKYYLELLWEECRKEFPQNKDGLVQQYFSFEKYMNDNVHPKVNEGAAASGDGVLTDHGPEHVQMVIHNAYSLLKGNNNNMLNDNHGNFDSSSHRRLNGYEIYILLLSIHFHDVGNIFGRNEHEKKIDEVMNKLGDKVPLDNAEKRMVRDIATSHGGFSVDNPNDMDTLKSLISHDRYSRLSVRHTLIASILRFADELADDNSRANRFAEIGKQNILFHEYSKSLYPIEFKHNSIAFEYDIPHNLMIGKIYTSQGETYLYDEILRRLTKCMCELEYCRKFSDGLIFITTLNITINVLNKDSSYNCEEKIKFDLRLSGYPDIKGVKIQTYLDKATELKYDCGESLKSSITAAQNSQEAQSV